ncbi:MAG TPA: hypothetical protein VHA74_01800 [Candidatus Dojkabacteria bacterium]|nr:hypothetical protein [Candidatus Dojkabacteria bacterium]
MDTMEKLSTEEKAFELQREYYNQFGVKVIKGGEINSPLVYTYELEKPLEVDTKQSPEVVMIAGVRNPSLGEYYKQIPNILESGVEKVHYIRYSYIKPLDIKEIEETILAATADTSKTYVLVGTSIGADIIAEFLYNRLTKGDTLDNLTKAILISPVLTSNDTLVGLTKKVSTFLKYGARIAERFPGILGNDPSHEVPPMTLSNAGRLTDISDALHLNSISAFQNNRKIKEIEVHWVKDPNSSPTISKYEYSSVNAQQEMLAKFRHLSHKVIFSRDIEGLHGGLSDPKTSSQYTDVIIKGIKSTNQ